MQDDRQLVSCDESGAIYEWDLARGRRAYDCVDKDNEYVSLSSAKCNGQSTFAVSRNGILREVLAGDIVAELKYGSGASFTSMCAMNASRFLVIGDRAGNLYQIGLPLSESMHDEYSINRWVAEL